MLGEFIDVFVEAEVLLVLRGVERREDHHAALIQPGHLGVLQTNDAKQLPPDRKEAVASYEPANHRLHHNGESPLPLVSLPHHVGIYYLGQIFAEMTQTSL
jgi:hypothetical protein